MRTFPTLLLLLLAARPALAQDQTTEDKLREALRRSTVDLRALQDSQAQLQADRDSATKQRDALQQQVADLQAKLAAQPQPGAPGAPPGPDQAAGLQDALRQAQAALDAARRDNAALSASNAKWQAAYQQAAGIAREKDAEAKQLAANLQTATKADQASYDANQKLALLAKDILHLYRTQSFRRLLLGSYEPVLGFKEVELENLVQDYDDRIYDLRIFKAKAP